MTTEIEIRTIFVQAFFKKLYKDRIFEVPTGETRRGFFGGEKPVMEKKTELIHVGFSDCEIDGGRLAGDVNEAIGNLAREGYEPLSVTPITSGNWVREFAELQIEGSTSYGSGKITGSGGYGLGYGYSFTEGVLIVGRQMQRSA